MDDPSRSRQTPPEFECGEFVAPAATAGDNNDDDAGGETVTFFCTVPIATTTTTTSCGSNAATKEQRRLEFQCRERSVGVLEENTDDCNVADDAKEEEEEALFVDPCFFDTGYTLAGRTGFQVWAGSRLLLESLLYPRSRSATLTTSSPTTEDPPRLRYWQEAMLLQQQQESQSLRVLELGAGVGLVGAALAAAGAQVWLTDLPSLVEHALRPNLTRNRNGNDTERQEAPPWLRRQDESNHNDNNNELDSSSASVSIGTGWARAAALDWTQPISEQQLSPRLLQNVDLIVASDCVWLVSMFEALLSTIHQLWQASPRASVLLSFQKRGEGGENDRKDESATNSNNATMFTTVSSILATIEARGWHWECLAWRTIRVPGEDRHGNRQEQEKPVYVLEVRQTPVSLSEDSSR